MEGAAVVVVVVVVVAAVVVVGVGLRGGGYRVFTRRLSKRVVAPRSR